MSPTRTSLFTATLVLALASTAPAQIWGGARPTPPPTPRAVTPPPVRGVIPAPGARPAARAPMPGVVPGRMPGVVPAPRPVPTPWGRTPRPAPGHPQNLLVPIYGSPEIPAGDGGGRFPKLPVSPTLDSVAASPGEKARAIKAAKEFRSLKVPGKEVAPAVRKLLKLRWYKKLRDAAWQAKKHDKPILWIQALGDLRTFT